MADWIESVTLTDEDLIDKINRAGSPTKTRMPGVEIPVGDAVAPCRVQLSRPLTDEEREQIKAAIIALAGQIEPGLIVDIALGTGVVAAQSFAGRRYMFFLESHLRVEPVLQVSHTLYRHLQPKTEPE